MSIYDSLNTEQRKAVEHTEGPVLILAGAGSGKTRVITHRIAYLMDECGVNPWNILAITFTNKAAQEMRERVDKLIGFGAESIWISTFHSMCVRILRRHIQEIGYQTDFTIYDTDDQKTLMKEVCRNLRINTKELRERTILAAISSAKDELLTPRRYQETHQYDFMQKQIGEAYEEYQRLLHKNNALDFDDLLMKTVELFNARGDILRNYQDRFRYIMVDEYQDTNTAQFELVRLLAGTKETGGRNLCVVGDDDQSIYKFRGANIRNILDFEKVYPDAFVVKLEQNYRSTQMVLDAANAVIDNNRNRKSKALWTRKQEGSRIHLRQFNTAMEEASFIAEDIERKKDLQPSLNYRDFAVLYRTNAQARLLEERLIMGSIPYNVVGGTNFYERREIKDMLAYLKVIDNGRDDLAVRRILNVPRRGIGAATVEKVSHYAVVCGDLGFFETLEKLCDGPVTGILSNAALGKIRPFVELIRSFRTELEEGASLEDLMKSIIGKTGYEEYLRDTEEEDADARLANIDELISKIVSYEEEAQELPDFAEQAGDTSLLTGFLADVALVADIDEMDGNQDRVLLMTLHSAKGLEFPQVYIAGLEDGLFPGYLSINSDDRDAMEEERRLMYVGITRAMDDLTLTCAHSRMLRGEVQYNPVSRFVTEIPDELLDERAGLPEFSSYRTSSQWGSTSRLQQSAYPQQSAYRQPAPEPPARRDTRLKAVYVKPHTPDEKKPFIGKASAGLASLQKGMPASEKPDYETGDRVRHVKFGDGTVLAMEKGPKDYKVTVLFDDAGQKIMYAAFARLEKL